MSRLRTAFFAYCTIKVSREIMNKKILFICVLLILSFAASVAFAQTRTIRDMRGVEVTIPNRITKVATIDDGFVEAIMTHLGVIETVQVIGSWALKLHTPYTFPSSSGEDTEHWGASPMRIINPWLDELDCITSRQGIGLDFEMLAAKNPDVVILRVGDCTIGAADKAVVNKSIATIEALGLPLVVLYAPSWFKNSDLSTLVEEASVIDSVFNKPEGSVELLKWLGSMEGLIRERTATIDEEKKTRLLYFGLSSKVRQQGAAGTAHGLDTPESYMVESVANAVNAFRGRGSGVPLSAEQVYALDPDVIVLPTFNGYHPASELYEADYYASLSELRAIRQKRVHSLPYSPKNCARRLEYPLDMLIIAKAAYPNLFEDIKVHEYALELYMKAYGIDQNLAEQVRSKQFLDWTVESDF